MSPEAQRPTSLERTAGVKNKREPSWWSVCFTCFIKLRVRSPASHTPGCHGGTVEAGGSAFKVILNKQDGDQPEVHETLSQKEQRQFPRETHSSGKWVAVG